MKINIKKILLVLIVFIVVYSLLILFSVNYADVTWNYGMSHAIRIGEIPYKDFNFLIPPLSQYLMSILLFIKDSYETEDGKRYKDYVLAEKIEFISQYKGE